MGVTDYVATTVTMPPASRFLAFTDGLVERRTEVLDLGMNRLAAAATSTDRPLEALISTILATMISDESEDDIAILAFEWTQPEPLATSPTSDPAMHATR